jgi:hypothetical protein
MSKTVAVPRSKKPTVQELAVQVHLLRERVEDLEDIRDLKEAVQRNGRKPLIPWANVKKDLDID